MPDILEVKMAQRGVVVIPKSLRETYNFKPGDRFSLLDLGGVLVLSPKVSEVDAIADRMVQSLADQGETLEGMLRRIREERERYHP